MKIFWYTLLISSLISLLTFFLFSNLKHRCEQHHISLF